MTANLGKPMRILYAIIGVMLIASPLLGGMKLWMQITLPALGVIAIITAASGW